MKLRNNNKADASTRKDEEVVHDSGNAAHLKHSTSAELLKRKIEGVITLLNYERIDSNEAVKRLLQLHK